MNLTPKSRLTLAAGGTALLLSVAGICSAVVQSPQSPAIAPPAAPAPGLAPTPAVPPVPDDAQSVSSSSAMWSIMTSQNGRTIKIDSKNGAITAEVDGKPVPADRISHTGDVVTIRDEKGDVIAEQNVPSTDTSTHIYTYGKTLPGHAWAGVAPRARGGRNFYVGPKSGVFLAQPDAPKVMIGVQLIDPDASLRGHLGLKDDEATMVSATYDGLPAATAGLEPYDVIISVNGKSPAPPATVRQALRDTEAGKTISLDVIHRGQKKTVSITPEKYDAEKLEKAKINQIAAAAGSPAAIAGFNPDDNNPFAQVWKFGGGNAPQPFAATIPGQGGRPMTLWSTPGMDEDMAKQMQGLMSQMQKQAEEMRQQAERMQQQFQGGGGVPGGGMDERMKRIEDYMRKMMERENKNGTKDENRS